MQEIDQRFHVSGPPYKAPPDVCSISFVSALDLILDDYQFVQKGQRYG